MGWRARVPTPLEPSPETFRMPMRSVSMFRALSRLQPDGPLTQCRAGAAAARSATRRSTASRLKGASASSARARVAGDGVVAARRAARPRVLAHQSRVERARDRQRHVGAGRGRRDEQAAVGERLELGDPVVLAPRGAHEHARATYERAVLREGSAPDDRTPSSAPSPCPAWSSRSETPATTSSRARPRAAPTHAPPRCEHAIEALLGRVGRICDRGDVPPRLGRPRRLDRHRQTSARSPRRAAAGASRSPPSLQGSSSGACSSLRRSSGRCHRP